MFRFMEIGPTGQAFHNTDFAGVTEAPPEILRCDCWGKDVHTFNPHSPKAHVEADPRQSVAANREEWVKAHTGPGHAIRRNITVDLLFRRDLGNVAAFYQAHLDGTLYYDEATDTFTIREKV